MMMRRHMADRRGAASLEAAVVFPVLFFLLLALVVGAMGVFRYQEVVLLAQEGARYASVHGKEYRDEVPGATVTTEALVREKVILPRIVALDPDPALLDVKVTWTNDSDEPFMVPKDAKDAEKPVNNTVTVTVTYKWFPELYLVGPITLSSTTTVPMAY